MRNSALIDRRAVIAGVLGLALRPRDGAAQALRFAGRELVSSGFGGSTQDIIQDAVFRPFDRATGAKSVQVPLQSAAAFARMRAEAASPQIDMFQFSGGQEQSAAAEKLAAPLAETPRLALLPARFKDAERRYVVTAVIAEGIVYRTDKIKTPPRSYQDFFKPEYDGHIAFPAVTNGYGLDFLVMLARTFGGGEKDIEPGFKALARIAPKASIFKAASDLPSLFGQNDVWIMPYDTGNAFKVRESGLPVAYATPEEGAPAVFITACVASGAKNADVAAAAIDFMLAPEAQTVIAEKMRWAPTNPETKLPDAIAADVPRPAQMAVLDRTTINAGRAAWTERWNREIAR
jgi:putative spermidine/putrescine transport system substrate-binding protein